MLHLFYPLSFSVIAFDISLLQAPKKQYPSIEKVQVCKTFQNLCTPPDSPVVWLIRFVHSLKVALLNSYFEPCIKMEAISHDDWQDIDCCWTKEVFCQIVGTTLSAGYKAWAFRNSSKKTKKKSNPTSCSIFLLKNRNSLKNNFASSLYSLAFCRKLEVTHQTSNNMTGPPNNIWMFCITIG